MIDLSNVAELKNWLQKEPRTVGIALSARAALRVFPVIGRPSAAASKFTLANATILQTHFRAVSVAWIAFGKHAAALSVEHGVRARAILTASAARPAGTFATNPAASAAQRSAAEAVLAVADTGRKSSAAAFAAIGETFSVAAALGDVERGVEAVAADIAFLAGRDPSALADAPLWPGRPPAWATERWQDVKAALENAQQNWQVWTIWYDDRLDGRIRSFERETAYIDVPYKFWEDGPEAVNAKIAQLIGASPVPAAQPPAQAHDSEEIPLVPALRPAALEPEWQGTRLTLPKKPAKTSLSERKFTDALAALRHELRDFSTAIAGQSNIDNRFVAFAQDLAARIPDGPPPQEELFRLGHSGEFFSMYEKEVDAEWPAFLAARYHALALQYRRTLLLSPSWREFMRHAAQQRFTFEQVESARELARGAADTLRGEELADPALASSLEQLADAQASRDERHPADVVENGKELLAADLVESVNNILKRIAEVAIPLVAAGRRAGAIAGHVAMEYSDNFEKGAMAAAKKFGKTDGERVTRLFRRLVAAVAAGELLHLITRFDTFAWLTQIMRYLG